jgi:hypothetical protein
VSGRTTHDDVLLLADAVNQLALVIEDLLPLTRNSGLEVGFARSTRAGIQERLRRERERVAPIIERYDRQ